MTSGHIAAANVFSCPRWLSAVLGSLGQARAWPGHHWAWGHGVTVSVVVWCQCWWDSLLLVGIAVISGGKHCYQTPLVGNTLFYGKTQSIQAIPTGTVPIPRTHHVPVPTTLYHYPVPPTTRYHMVHTGPCPLTRVNGCQWPVPNGQFGQIRHPRWLLFLARRPTSGTAFGLCLLGHVPDMSNRGLRPLLIGPRLLITKKPGEQHCLW